MFNDKLYFFTYNMNYRTKIGILMKKINIFSVTVISFGFLGSMNMYADNPANPILLQNKEEVPAEKAPAAPEINPIEETVEETIKKLEKEIAEAKKNHDELSAKALENAKIYSDDGKFKKAMGAAVKSHRNRLRHIIQESMNELIETKAKELSRNPIFQDYLEQLDMGQLALRNPLAAQIARKAAVIIEEKEKGLQEKLSALSF